MASPPRGGRNWPPRRRRLPPAPSAEGTPRPHACRTRSQRRGRSGPQPAAVGRKERYAQRRRTPRRPGSGPADCQAKRGGDGAGPRAECRGHSWPLPCARSHRTRTAIPAPLARCLHLARTRLLARGLTSMSTTLQPCRRSSLTAARRPARQATCRSVSLDSASQTASGCTAMAAPAPRRCTALTLPSGASRASDACINKPLSFSVLRGRKEPCDSGGGARLTAQPVRLGWPALHRRLAFLSHSQTETMAGSPSPGAMLGCFHDPGVHNHTGPCRRASSVLKHVAPRRRWPHIGSNYAGASSQGCQEGTVLLRRGVCGRNCAASHGARLLRPQLRAKPCHCVRSSFQL